MLRRAAVRASLILFCAACAGSMRPAVIPMPHANVSEAVATVPPRMIVSNAMSCLIPFIRRQPVYRDEGSQRNCVALMEGQIRTRGAPAAR